MPFLAQTAAVDSTGSQLQFGRNSQSSSQLRPDNRGRRHIGQIGSSSKIGDNSSGTGPSSTALSPFTIGAELGSRRPERDPRPSVIFGHHRPRMADPSASTSQLYQNSKQRTRRRAVPPSS
ncbi:unnamed protein product [Cuscuta europaea]|uniref:Uncharacterized protein n=1 Tax=Cuscuta europaea TaxID=41803 RepID=A0A9P1DZD2_CUSEU|nr:unnamed protein product [Cuscuta europaea]